MEGEMLDLIRKTIEDSINLKKALLENAELLTNIHKAAELCIDAYRRGNRILLAGNGGSAADDHHRSRGSQNRGATICHAFPLPLLKVTLIGATPILPKLFQNKPNRSA